MQNVADRIRKPNRVSAGNKFSAPPSRVALNDPRHQFCPVGSSPIFTDQRRGMPATGGNSAYRGTSGVDSGRPVRRPRYVPFMETLKFPTARKVETERRRIKKRPAMPHTFVGGPATREFAGSAANHSVASGSELAQIRNASGCVGCDASPTGFITLRLISRQVIAGSSPGLAGRTPGR